MRITSPPRASVRKPNSDSGSRIRISSLVERATLTISSLAEKDLPEPETPRRKLLPFKSLRLSTTIMLLSLIHILLILDEPTSQLDPIAASDFLATIGKINRELGVTVILTEHRLEEAFPMATRVVVMDSGRILCSGTPENVGMSLRNSGHGMFLAMPTAMRVWAEFDTDLKLSLIHI